MSEEKRKCPKCKSGNVNTPTYSEDNASVQEYECLDCSFKESNYIGGTQWDYSRKEAMKKFKDFDENWTEKNREKK